MIDTHQWSSSYLSLLNRVSCLPACQRAKSVLNSYFYVPKCCTACHCFILTCQSAKWRANFSTWRANVTKAVPFFKHFCYQVQMQFSKKNFYTLLFYKKFYILLDIIVTHIICICIVNKSCVILYLYTSCHIKEKCVEFFFFIISYFLAL